MNFYTNSTVQIAQNLLGYELRYHTDLGIMAGIIVETEAYLGPLDSTSHTYKRRRTQANEALYHLGGTIYIHQQQGHYLLDIVTQSQDNPQSVLIRALEPTQGLGLMQNNRKSTGINLTNGPAKWMQAFGIQSKKLNLTILGDQNLNLSSCRMKDPLNILNSARIHVSQHGSWTKMPLRFYVEGNPYVSKIKKSTFNWDNCGWQL
ncbi:DNA-3-methyladenine glycosylase [Bombilactobacillus folatiphilus]|uniref:Putative 3-methyladenine DNA glycosylase n=1 Tax=Bombilactobacillus folatiphilus TaxID=2923362 RepID=A0ABY4P880_9LACO|nr:DNA-3-methyladenine glycosylase [Bombilactobacillus folatiphilus]UQS81842.1 DNA-3-methyladenine glycosylase [Bombilactobacillus folatiphilus]